MAPKDQIHRTTIDIEVEAFRRAREALGTNGYRDTINEALSAVGRAAELRRGAALIRAGGLDLVDPDELAKLRSGRLG
jgi:predicted O-methyltransferase YrrM